MATELPGLLKELKQSNNDKEVKPRYKALRLRSPYKTFRELKEAFPRNPDDLRVFGGGIYEYWDDQHFKTTWIERVLEKVYWDDTKKDKGDWKWRKRIRLKSVLEPQWPHNEDYRKDLSYWVSKGVSLALIQANWGDPTSVLQNKEDCWIPDPNWTHLDEEIPDFRRRELIGSEYQDVHVQDI
jgi:hypothetical protein